VAEGIPVLELEQEVFLEARGADKSTLRSTKAAKGIPVRELGQEAFLGAAYPLVPRTADPGIREREAAG
jgi:hypothetical protein